MRKELSLVLILALAFSLCGCGQNAPKSKRAGNGPTGVNDVLSSAMSATTENTTSETTTAVSTSESLSVTKETSASKDGIDLDLSILSSTAVYAEVYGMVLEPEEYVGKTIKMKGAFDVYHDETTDIYYFACVIQDATACCSSGIEFVLQGEHVYPDDYPKVGEEVNVIGVFETYKEGNTTYCRLKDARLV